MKFVLLILSLPTESATERMRSWRALKASGATVLRDGVYLMPDIAHCVSQLEQIAHDITASSGHAYVLPTEVDADQAQAFIQTFDRSANYAPLFHELTQLRETVSLATAQADQKRCRKLGKAFQLLAQTDFFPGPAKSQVESALAEAERTCALLLSSTEPGMADTPIAPMALADFQARQWATRSRPYVDRLACAWLVRRFIDPKASFLWLEHPDDCPKTAVGYDFEGAQFSHSDQMVTFEVLISSFGLAHVGLRRMAQLVHFLDIGGIEPAEAAGVESVLAGLRDSISNDDALVNAAGRVLDGLLAHFEKVEAPI